jgi:hypothetical protein
VPGWVTQRNKMFLREYIKIGVASEAWRKVYPDTGWQYAKDMASRTLAKPHVRAYYDKLLERHMRKADITIEKILTDYQEALNLAKLQNKAGEIVAAATAQAKIVGLLRDRVEHGNVGEFGDVADVATVLEIVAQQAGPEAALALSAVFGLDKPSPEIQEQAEQLLEATPPTDAVN